ncbi:phosphoserine transaminase [Ravibacter arvi]|uniref:Phosphoserine transaminase n=1 Tax=Ravibacter arvi TaxID=2051041 RepID=A0ABP8MB76_9BACT
MITFYPGPSKLYPQIESFLTDAYRSGLLSMNHRSKPFMEMLGKTIAVLKEKLLVPDAYEVVFTSSATECWEIVAQSLTPHKSFHLYNGAFGEKWSDYAGRIHGRTVNIPYNLNEQPGTVFPDHGDRDLLCLTQTETSNGTAVDNLSLQAVRSTFKGLVAVDATSGMAGVSLPWETADIWFASVQKCFGLPSGLAVMILSPRAVEASDEVGEKLHYNSLPFVIENFRKLQTPYTPNILGIYLLNRLMSTLDPIDLVSRKLENRSLMLYQFLEQHGFSPLVENSAVRSHTVVAVQDSKENVAAVKAFALSKHIMLGNGYGQWKESAFRIANFPAITDPEVSALKECLLAFKNS